VANYNYLRYLLIKQSDVITYVHSRVHRPTNFHWPYKHWTHWSATDCLWPGIHGHSPAGQCPGSHET